MKKVYEVLAGTAQAYHNCIKTNNTHWQEKHVERMNQIVDDCLPRGSGIDSGCTLDHDKSNDQKLLIYSSYHAMNDNGMYDGWITFTVTVKPSLAHHFELSIKGNFGKYQDIKDYLYQIFDEGLMKDID